MTENTPSPDLDQILARADAATDGPWIAFQPDNWAATPETGDDGAWWWVWKQAALPNYGGVMQLHAPTGVAGDELYDAAGLGEVLITDGRDSAQEQADAEFIAAARVDVPALVAEVRQLRAELDSMRVETRTLDDGWAGMLDTVVTAWSVGRPPTVQLRYVTEWQTVT